VLKGALHNGGELDLERLDGSDGRNAVVAAQAVDVEFALGDVGNIVVLEVEDTLGVLDDGAGVRGDKKLDRLWEAIVCEEGTRLAPDQLGTSRGRGSKESARLAGAAGD
jgi:hypothetical protein